MPEERYEGVPTDAISNQNRRQKDIYRGLYVSAGVLEILKFDKNFTYL